MYQVLINPLVAGEQAVDREHAVVATLHRVVRESLSYKVMSEQMNEGVSHVDIRGEYLAQVMAGANI